MTTRSSKELLDHLNEQLGFLRKSCENFDEGSQSEAKRIAAVLRTILHDTKYSVSILKQLNMKESIDFLDTIPRINPNNLLSSSDFLKMKIEPGRVIYLPTLNDSPWFDINNRCKYEVWKSKPIYKNKSILWNREDCFLELANKEGGAHVDPKLGHTYKSIVEEGRSLWGLTAVTDISNKTDVIHPEENIVFVAVRQIGFEVLETLNGNNWENTK